MTPGLPRTAPGLALHLALLGGPVLLLAGPQAFDAPLVLFLALVAALHLAEAAGSGPRRVAHAVAPAIVSAMTLLAVFAVGMIDHVTTQRPVPLPLALAGSSLAVAGIALRRASIRTLGDRFLDEVGVLPGHALQTTGLYAVLRHPSETGSLCVGAGAAMVLGSPAAATAWLAGMVPAALLRAKLEDRVLAERFGREFGEYRRRVGGIVPSPLLSRAARPAPTR